MHHLLAPIEGTVPTGADLSFSPDFDAIAEKRRADDPTLSQGEWIAQLKVADWPGVATACENLLAHRTKDLRVAGWLLEAWAQLRGYEGLADGIELAHGMCASFWPALHPQPDQGDAELRTGALSRLVGQIAALTPTLPVLRAGARSYSLREIEAALLQKARDAGEQASPAHASADDITRAQRETPPAVLAERLADARRAREALGRLEAVVDAQLGADGPAFGHARRALDDAVHALDRMARDGGAVVPPVRAAVVPTASGATATAAIAPAGSAAVASASGVASRAEAIARLREVAAFFRASEPHSPVAYLAERAAHWAELPLHEWLRLVLKDGGSLTQLEELLGVPPVDGSR